MDISRTLGALAAVAIASGAHAGLSSSTTVTDFEDGAEGWEGPMGPGGVSFIDSENGVGGSAGLRTRFENFHVGFDNISNPAFVNDYTQFESVTLSIDVKADRLEDLAGNEQIRPFLVELKDFDSAAEGLPYASAAYVFTHDLGGAADGEFTTFSTTIENTRADELPAGWLGAGYEEPDGSVVFPPDLSFSELLSGIDVVSFNTAPPNYAHTFSVFDLTIDNVTITTTVPSPGPAALFATSGLIALRRRR